MLPLLLGELEEDTLAFGFVEALGELWNAAMEIDGQLLTDSLANRSP